MGTARLALIVVFAHALPRSSLLFGCRLEAAIKSEIGNSDDSEAILGHVGPTVHPSGADGNQASKAGRKAILGGMDPRIKATGLDGNATLHLGKKVRLSQVDSAVRAAGPEESQTSSAGTSDSVGQSDLAVHAGGPSGNTTSHTGNKDNLGGQDDPAAHPAVHAEESDRTLASEAGKMESHGQVDSGGHAGGPGGRPALPIGQKARAPKKPPKHVRRELRRKAKEALQQADAILFSEPGDDGPWGVSSEEALRFVTAIGGEEEFKSVLSSSRVQYVSSTIAAVEAAEKEAARRLAEIKDDFIKLLKGARKARMLTHGDQDSFFRLFSDFMAQQMQCKEFVDWVLSQEGTKLIIQITKLERRELVVMRRTIRTMSEHYRGGSVEAESSFSHPMNSLAGVEFSMPPVCMDDATAKLRIQVNAASLLDIGQFFLRCVGSDRLFRIQFTKERTSGGRLSMQARLQPGDGYRSDHYPTLQPWFLDSTCKSTAFFGRLRQPTWSYAESLLGPLNDWKKDPNRKEQRFPGALAFAASRSGMYPIVKVLAVHIVEPGRFDLRRTCLGARTLGLLAEMLEHGVVETPLLQTRGVVPRA